MSIQNLPLRFTCILLFIFIAAEAQIPDGYYDAAVGKTGAALKTALNQIIKDHTEFPYTSSATDVWDILKETDRDLDNADNVILLYSGLSVNADQEYNYGNGWTREHVWAKSRGDFGTDSGAGTDIHHLRPENDATNSARNNRWFDYSDTPHYYNGNPTGNYYSDENWTWEPRDAVKGDVARMIFYMATRYEGENGEPDLEVIDYLPADNNTKDPIHAKLSALMEWHVFDPVDDWERNRNDIIYSNYQHNRNPFIDHPEYVARIWSGDSSGTIPDSLFFSEYIEGSDFNKALEIYNASTHSINLSNYAILANYNNNPWYQTHHSFPAGAVLEPGAVWVIMNSGFDSTYHSVADELTSAAVVNFNGNDVRALVKFDGADTTFLDVIGVYGDTAEVAAWSVAGIGAATENHTLVRKPSVKCGNPDWHSSAGTDSLDSEWIVAAGGTFDFLGYHTIDTVSAIGICSAASAVEYFRLYGCYPNPFNSTTKIRYDLETTATVTLQIFDLRGVLVKTLLHTRQQPGHYRVAWDARDQQHSSVPAGVYLYRLQTAEGFGQTGKMMYLK